MEEERASQGGSASAPGRVWPRRLAWVCVTALVLYLLFGFIVLPRIVEGQLVSNTQAQLGLEPAIADVRFDPFRLRLTVEGFELKEPEASLPLLAFESMVADLRLLGFFGADVAFDELRLVRPQVSLVVEESGELALVRLLRGAPARSETSAEPEEKGAEEEAAELLVVDVASVRIDEGLLWFEDRSVSPAFEATVTPIDLDVEAFTTRGIASAPSHLALSIEERTRLRWEGTLSANPIRSEGRLEVAGFDLRLPWQRASELLRFEVVEGKLALALRYALDLEEGLDLRIDEGAVEVNDLRVVDREDASEVLTLPSLGAEEIALAVGPQGVEALGVGAVIGRGGRIAARIEADGGLQLPRLLTPRSLDSDPAAPASDASETPQSSVLPQASSGLPASEPEAAGGETESPEIVVGRLRLEDFAIGFEDRSRSSPVELALAPIDLEISDFRSTPGQPAGLRLDVGLGEGGRITVSGNAEAQPLAAKLTIEATRIGLSDFQPYLETAARLDLVSGLLTSRLDVALGPEEGGDALPLTAQGDLRIDDLRARDRALERDFVGWGALRLEGIDLAPGRLHLATVGLEGAAAAIVIDSRGRSNVAAIFAAGEGDDAEAAPADATADERFAISIERVSLSDTRLSFDDLSVEPPVGIVLSGLQGEIAGLSSSAATRARVDLEGHVNKRAPLRLSGEINPLAMESGGRLALSARGIPLPGLSGYSGRYVGWGIAAGGLDLDLDYALDGRDLKARNHFLVEQLDLGKRIGERTTLSTSLPLALVVMRDGAGNLDLNVPVSGNLDDPDFSVLGVLGQTLTNLVMKAATSPLALLPVRGGGDASRVAFVPGSAQLLEAEIPSLEAVARVLADAPQVRLEIQGRADVEIDGAALGLESSASAEAREEALASLARDRAARVREALVADGQLDPERVGLDNIEIGAVAKDGVVTTNLWLSTR